MKLVKKIKQKHLQLINEAKRSHPGLYAFTGGVGVIMFWFGLWEGLHYVPVLGIPWVAMLIGLSILMGTGLLMFELIGDAEGLKSDDGQEPEVNYYEERLKILEAYVEKQEVEFEDNFS